MKADKNADGRPRIRPEQLFSLEKHENPVGIDAAIGTCCTKSKLSGSTEILQRSLAALFVVIEDAKQKPYPLDKALRNARGHGKKGPKISAEFSLSHLDPGDPEWPSSAGPRRQARRTEHANLRIGMA